MQLKKPTPQPEMPINENSMRRWLYKAALHVGLRADTARTVRDWRPMKAVRYITNANTDT